MKSPEKHHRHYCNSLNCACLLHDHQWVQDLRPAAALSLLSLVKSCPRATARTIWSSACKWVWPAGTNRLITTQLSASNTSPSLSFRESWCSLKSECLSLDSLYPATATTIHSRRFMKARRNNKSNRWMDIKPTAELKGGMTHN